MTIDITSFNTLNVIDSCAIDNLLSSQTLYSASLNAKCKFCYTEFVKYEMLYKERKRISITSKVLTKKLESETLMKNFECFSLSISDLQDISTLEESRKLGIGELSSIIFAKKINQSFMTDDQGARKLASLTLGKDRVQTTPHLLGWLFYTRELIDSDYNTIITEHESQGRPLKVHLERAYHESLKIKLMQSSNQNT